MHKAGQNRTEYIHTYIINNINNNVNNNRPVYTSNNTIMSIEFRNRVSRKITQIEQIVFFLI